MILITCESKCKIMTNKITFCFSLVILFIFIAEVKCEFEKVKFFLNNYEITKVTNVEYRTDSKFIDLDFAEKSIQIKAFGKTFIVDLVFYYQREDAEIAYISKSLNSSDSYLAYRYFTYQGYVRDVKDSFALGYISETTLFRGYIVTDEVYCIEPYGEQNSVIVYRFKDVIVPGCSQSHGEDKLDCTETEYYSPWNANKPPPKEKLALSYSLLYDKYLALFNRLQAKKGNTDIKDKNKDNKSENDKNSDGNFDNRSPDKKQKKDYKKDKKKDYDKIYDPKDKDYNHGDHKNSKKHKAEDKDGDEKQLKKQPKDNKIEISNEISSTDGELRQKQTINITTNEIQNSNTERLDENKNKIQGHENVAKNTNKDVKSFEKDEDRFKNENYPENRLHTVHLKMGNKTYNINDSNDSTDILTDDIDHVVKWKQSANGANKNLEMNKESKQSMKKRSVNEPIVKAVSGDATGEQCNVQLIIGKSFREKFGSSDEIVIKEVFMQFALLNKIFQKVPFVKNRGQFHLIFNLEQIILHGDDVYSPFNLNANLEYFTKIRRDNTRSHCLSIGLVNKFLNSGQFFDGYIPEAGGGVCSLNGNTLIISHGNAHTPAPMALFFAALFRGITRAVGANDKNSQCTEGSYPNPMQVLQDYILAKEIKPTKEYSIFTACNVKEIEEALRVTACLITIEKPLCGNAILDEGEECDCGPAYLCHKVDPCCNPPRSQFSPIKTKNEKKSKPQGCTLVKGANCSKSQKCCSGCQIETMKRVCSSGVGICDIATCDGKSAHCPSGVEFSNGMICSTFNETMPEPLLCKDNKCDQPLCSGFGLKPCTCAYGSRKECSYCCLKDGRCKAAGADLKLIPEKDFFVPDGVECMGGTCVDGKCTSLSGEHVIYNFTLKKPPRFPTEVNFCCKPSALKSFISLLLSLLLFHLV